MTPTQLSRMELLEDKEIRTPAEEAEYAYLQNLSSDLRQAYDLLVANDMQPAWIAGEYVLVGREIVRSLADAQRVVRS